MGDSVLRALPFGDVNHRNKHSVTSFVDYGSRVDLDQNLASIRSHVSSYPSAVVTHFAGRNLFPECRPIRFGPDLESRHGEELLARVAVVPNHRVIHGEKSKSLEIEDPHRKWIIVEEEAEGGFAALQVGNVDPNANG